MARKRPALRWNWCAWSASGAWKPGPRNSAANPAVTTFIKGLELSRQFYLQAVRPLLEARFPGLPYAAGLIGSGSEVLGFDTEMSSDHHWGPRVMLFLQNETGPDVRLEIEQILADHLPVSFMGYPTNFSPSNPQDKGVRLLQAIDQGPVAHRVEISNLDGFFHDYLGGRSVRLNFPRSIG